MVALPHWLLTPWTRNNKSDLKTFERLLAALDDPHLKIPPTIHIAGTNGKGSSCAYFRAIFAEAGYKAHVYTSPHLVEYNERIVVANEQISDDFLFELGELVREVASKNNIQLTFFEATTAIAFLAFSAIPADIVILETGIGGRLDATNIIASPLLTLITSISYDHINILGDSLKLIAGEKAGIIKANISCVIGFQTQEVYQLLLHKCQKLNSPAFCYEYDYGITKTDNGFIYSSRKLLHEFPMPNLLGDHQLINAAGVVAAISLINEKFQLNAKHISQGLKKAHWPARIQKINAATHCHLIDGSATIWLDGAHNSSGAQALALWIKENLIFPTYLILGITKGRNIKEFCSYFNGLITKGYGVRVLSETSSYSGETIAEQAKLANLNFQSLDSITEAIHQVSLENNEKCNIIICGSLFLAADFFKLIK